MKNVEQVISFATFPDETAVEADYIFPDRHGLESWGYQRVATGTSQSVLSGSQPVVSGVYKPDVDELLYDTRATVDVLIAALQLAGDEFVEAVPFQNEVEFIQSKVSSLMNEADGLFSAADGNSFMAYFQQHGGWWKLSDGRGTPNVADVLNRNISAQESQFAGEGEFFFVPYVFANAG